MSALANILRALGFAPAKPANPGEPPAPSEIVAPNVPPFVVDSGPAWRALPGNRIELGATGFYIEHRPADAQQRAYWLWSPEGVLLATAGPMYLQGLKQMAEKIAADRSEFEVSGEGWKP